MKRRSLKLEPQRQWRKPQELQLRNSKPWELVESSRSLPEMDSSSTCVARCPSDTGSGGVGTSSREGPTQIGSRRPTTIRDSRCTEVTSRPTTFGSRIDSATDVTTDGG